MSRHTPGPWRAERWMVDVPSARLFGPHGEVLARLYCVRDEEVANLELVAAAPDLYEAAQMAMRGEDYSGSSVTEKGLIWSQAVALLRAAIAKAEGREAKP